MRGTGSERGHSSVLSPVMATGKDREQGQGGLEPRAQPVYPRLPGNSGHRGLSTSMSSVRSGFPGTRLGLGRPLTAGTPRPPRHTAGIHELSVRGRTWRGVGRPPTQDRPISLKTKSTPARHAFPVPRPGLRALTRPWRDPRGSGRQGRGDAGTRGHGDTGPAPCSAGRGAHRKACTRLRSANSCSSTNACSTLMLNSSLERQGRVARPLRPPRPFQDHHFLEPVAVEAALPAPLLSGLVRGDCLSFTTGESGRHDPKHQPPRPTCEVPSPGAGASSRSDFRRPGVGRPHRPVMGVL